MLNGSFFPAEWRDDKKEGWQTLARIKSANYLIGNMEKKLHFGLENVFYNQRKLSGTE